MIVVISGTNRADSMSLKVARLVAGLVEAGGEEAFLVDLRDMPESMYRPGAYATRPPELEPYQEAILAADGILTVVPEYNGSFPGVLKYFIDMLRFPESLVETPAAFVGISAGQWGALRAVEQLEMVFQYRSAHLYGRRVFLGGIGGLLDADGRIVDAEARDRLQRQVRGFVEFCRRLGA